MAGATFSPLLLTICSRISEEVIYPLVPQRRLLTVEEIADYTMFLASDKAKGVTGQAVVIDGGYTAQ